MLKLDTQARPNVRVDLADGAFIEFRPLTTPGLIAGRAIARDVIAAGQATSVAGVGFAIGCARWGAVAWGGIGDEKGKALELTPDNLQLLLEDSEASFTAVQLGYVWPALARDAEKNGSAPARDGTSRAPRKPTPKAKGRGAGSSTAKDAKRTARRPATPAPRS